MIAATISEDMNHFILSPISTFFISSYYITHSSYEIVKYEMKEGNALLNRHFLHNDNR